MPRVLQVMSSTIFAGAEHQVLELAKGLRPLGHTVELLIFYRQHVGLPPVHPMVGVARRAGFQADQRPDPSRLSPRMFLMLRSRLAFTRYDLVHTHGYKADILGAVAAWLAGVPCVATVHLHTRDTAWVWLYRQLDLWVLRRLPRVIAVSNYLRQELIDAGLNPARVVAVHNAIDLDAFVSRAKAPLPPELRGDRDGPIITCIARLTPQKGHADLLATASAVLA
ncbi:MAG: glycosyltransferase, partial [Chloroflexi bacterium]|nr:glycosyltransferase [Chloroflexota bacterium]